TTRRRICATRLLAGCSRSACSGQPRATSSRPIPFIGVDPAATAIERLGGRLRRDATVGGRFPPFRDPGGPHPINLCRRRADIWAEHHAVGRESMKATGPRTANAPAIEQSRRSSVAAAIVMARKTDGVEVIDTTLWELVWSVSEITSDEREVVATVRALLRSGAVRLCGTFRDCSIESLLG